MTPSALAARYKATFDKKFMVALPFPYYDQIQARLSPLGLPSKACSLPRAADGAKREEERLKRITNFAITWQGED